MAPNRERGKPPKCSSSSFVDRLTERYLAKHGDKDLTKVMPVFDPLHDLGQLIIAGKFDLPPDMVISVDHLNMLPRSTRKRKNQTTQEVGIKRTVFQPEQNSHVEILEATKTSLMDVYPSRSTAAEALHGQISFFPSDLGQREEEFLQGISSGSNDHQPVSAESHKHVYLYNHPSPTAISIQDKHTSEQHIERSPALMAYQEHIAEYKALRETHCDVEANQLLAHHLNNNTLKSLRKVGRFDPQSDLGKLILGGRSTLPSGCTVPPQYRGLCEEKTEEHRLARKAMLRVVRKAIEAEKKVPLHQRSEVNLSSAIRWLKADKYPMWDGRQSASSFRADDSEGSDEYETELTTLSPKRSADLRISINVPQPPASELPTLKQHIEPEPVAVQLTSSLANHASRSVLSNFTSVLPGRADTPVQEQSSPLYTTNLVIDESVAAVLCNAPCSTPPAPPAPQQCATPAPANSAFTTIPPSLMLLSNLVKSKALSSKALSPNAPSTTPSPSVVERVSSDNAPGQRNADTLDDTHHTGRSSRALVVDRDVEDYQRYIAEYEALRAQHCDPEVCAIFEHHMKNQTLATETMTTFDPQSDMGKLVLGGRSGLPSRCFVPQEYKSLLAEKAEEHKQARAAMLRVARKAFAAEYHVPAYQRSKINLWLEKGKYPMWDPHRAEAGMRRNQSNEQYERDRSRNNWDSTRVCRGREQDDRSAEREVPAAKRARGNWQEEGSRSRCDSSARVAASHMADIPPSETKVASLCTAMQHTTDSDGKVYAAPLALFRAPLSPLPVAPVVPSVVDSVRLELAQIEKLYNEFMANN